MRFTVIAAIVGAAGLGLAPGCSAIDNVVAMVLESPVAPNPASRAYFEVTTVAELDVRAWLTGMWWKELQAEAQHVASLPSRNASAKQAIHDASDVGWPIIIEMTFLAEAYREARDADAPALDIDAARARLSDAIDRGNQHVSMLAAGLGLEIDIAEEE
ncbi:MAG: hypothetical protein SGJ21_04370 [Alphaproteobacteria bacterium]|nr:hypothetical protein [Alphaproteobacteria bacterium]